MAEELKPTDDAPVPAPTEPAATAGVDGAVEPPSAPVADAPEGASDDAKPPVAAAVVAVPPAPRPPLSFLLIVSFINLAADLGSKWWAKATLDEPLPLGIRRIEVIKGHLGFVFAKNKGGAWGLLQDEHDSIRRPFFLLISAAAVIFIVSLYRRLTPEQHALKWGLPLVLGGALGNLVDRVRYGYVIDFIDIRVTRTFTWPTFNVADVAICVGVGLMAIDMFTSRKSRSGGSAPQAPESSRGAAAPQASESSPVGSAPQAPEKAPSAPAGAAPAGADPVDAPPSTPAAEP